MLNLFRDYAKSRTPAAIVAFPVEPTIMIPWLAVVPSKVAYKNIEAATSVVEAVSRAAVAEDVNIPVA